MIKQLTELLKTVEHRKDIAYEQSGRDKSRLHEATAFSFVAGELEKIISSNLPVMRSDCVHPHKTPAPDGASYWCKDCEQYVM